MNVSLNRPSRPRQYDLTPVPTLPHPEAAYAAAAIDELRERLCDIIADLPPEAMNYLPEGAGNTIAMLTVHMAWAEATWVARATGQAIPPALGKALLPGKQGPSGDLIAYSNGATDLITLCDQVRQEVTLPGLSRIQDLETPLADDPRDMTVRSVLWHLIWHWTYHSGQVGLLRRLWGSRYKWTFASK
jgi:uncharacterized damage-inducible protein DinB